jgi:hypothetical protein
MTAVSTSSIQRRGKDLQSSICNLTDMSDSYAGGESEIVMGQAIKKYKCTTLLPRPSSQAPD